MPKDQFMLEAIYEDMFGNEFQDNIELNITPYFITKSRTDLDISEGSLLGKGCARGPAKYL